MKTMTFFEAVVLSALAMAQKYKIFNLYLKGQQENHLSSRYFCTSFLPIIWYYYS